MYMKGGERYTDTYTHRTSVIPVSSGPHHIIIFATQDIYRCLQVPSHAKISYLIIHFICLRTLFTMIFIIRETILYWR